MQAVSNVIFHIINFSVAVVLCLTKQMCNYKSETDRIDYCCHFQDLAKLLDEMVHPFTEPQVKCLMQQLFRALNYMHSHYVLHRDLKVCRNCLLNYVFRRSFSGSLRLFKKIDCLVSSGVFSLG